MSFTAKESMNGDEVNQVPSQLQAALPSDPFEQLEMARRIADMAWRSRVKMLETEGGQLKDGSEGVVKSLQNRVVELEQTLRKTSDKLSKAMEEHVKLTGERNALVATVKKLNRDVAKLETFKRTLMQQLQDEPEEEYPESQSQQQTPRSEADSPANLRDKLRSLGPALLSGVNKQSARHTSQGNEAGEGDGPVARAAEEDGVMIRRSLDSSTGDHPSLPPTSSGFSRSNTLPGGEPAGNNEPGVDGRSVGPRMLRTRTPVSRTPSRTPSFSPLMTPGATSPHGSAQGSPRSRPNRVDGKEFFRQARNRLSYEQFSGFLANIKELNAHRQTREETLKKAREIFGQENEDLYGNFEGLLSRHLP